METKKGMIAGGAATSTQQPTEAAALANQVFSEYQEALQGLSGAERKQALTSLLLFSMEGLKAFTISKEVLERSLEFSLQGLMFTYESVGAKLIAGRKEEGEVCIKYCVDEGGELVREDIISTFVKSL